MVAAGPFTAKGDLLYEGLQELMAKVRQEMPHVLVLLGPFVDGMNEDVQSGNISFRNSTGQLEFLDFNDIFTKVMEYIKSEIDQLSVQTKLVIVPSAREIHHISPLPQPPYS
jgi:DNA polymerase alpha subunit B